MRRIIFGILPIALIVGGIGQAQASLVTVTSLFNTGVDVSGIPLVDATIGDPHYKLVTVPNGITDIRVRTSAGGFPIPPYVGNNLISAWIGPNNDAALDGPPGFYIYETTFNLTGLNPSTAQITGNWSSDNNGARILINGIDTGNNSTISDQFRAFAPFSINSGFQSGINTLEFIVYNEPYANGAYSPTALRVEMTGTAAVVPLPAAIWLFGTTLAGLIGFARRK